MKKIIFVTLFTILTACTDEAASYKTLKSAGFSDIKFTGYDIFSCAEDDTFSTGFSAKNPNGEYVTGTVCCGVTKSCTIRF